eukprot:748038-Hanusia_phi.AAC.3
MALTVQGWEASAELRSSWRHLAEMTDGQPSKFERRRAQGKESDSVLVRVHLQYGMSQLS